MDGIQGQKVSSQRQLSINTLQTKFEKSFITIIFDKKSEWNDVTGNDVFDSKT